MGNFFSKTKNIENKFINKIVSLYSGQLALLSNSEIEIISQDTLETNITIKGDNFINLFQISNGNIVIFSDLKIKIISLKYNNEYDTIQEIENDNKIIFVKLLQTKDEIFFIKKKINYDILIDIYNNTTSSNEKINKKNNFVINKTNSIFFDVEYLPQKNEFIFLFTHKLKFFDKKTFNLKHEITNEDFHLDFQRDVLCLLDDNHVLIGTHKNLYILNINNYEFVSIIRHDNIIKGINTIKKDLNGNVVLTANNSHNIKGFFTPKDFLIVYKYNKNKKKLEKIYDDTLSERIIDFVCLNENKIAFILEYFPFFGGMSKEYLKISSYNY